MIRACLVVAASAAVLAFSPLALAQPTQHGTAEQAKALLVKAVAAVKKDKTKAIDMFTKGEGGFLDRDLYVFCFNIPDGKILTTQAKQLIGSDIRALKDGAGKAYGLELYAASEKAEGQFTEVDYMFPRPGLDTKPVPKVSYVTKVGDAGCGVGYYK